MNEGQQKKAVDNDSIELGLTEESQNKERPQWKDVPFAISFYLSLVVTAGIALFLITRIDRDVDDEDEPGLSFELDLLQIFVGVLLCIVFTFSWLAVVVFCASCIIKTILVVTPFVLAIMAVVAFVAGSVFMGFLLLLIAAFRAWYAWAVWNRIPFATACLEVAIAVLRKFFSPIFVNFGMGIIAIFVVAFDLAAIYGVANVVKSSGAAYFAMFFLFLAYFWHSIVCFNVAHVTSCGVMGTYLLRKDTDSATCGSLTRALTTSFGSICFGALIEAAIRALLAMLREAERRNRGSPAIMAMLCVLRCIVGCIAEIVEYFNSFAFVYVALYGESYLDSAKAVWAAAKSKGLEALINDDLTGIPLIYGLYFMLIVMVVICWAIWGLSFNIIIAAACGMVIYLCTVHTVISYIKTLFVVWINDPDTFHRVREEEFNRIMDAARNHGYNTQWAQRR